MLNIFIIGLVPVSGAIAKPEKRERAIALFKEKVDKNLIKQARGNIHHEYKHVNGLAVTVPSQAIKGLEQNPNVAAIEKDQFVKVTQIRDWGIQRTPAPVSRESGVTGQGVKVAVVDTGSKSRIPWV